MFLASCGTLSPTAPESGRWAPIPRALPRPGPPLTMQGNPVPYLGTNGWWSPAQEVRWLFPSARHGIIWYILYEVQLTRILSTVQMGQFAWFYENIIIWFQEKKLLLLMTSLQYDLFNFYMLNLFMRNGHDSNLYLYIDGSEHYYWYYRQTISGLE